MAAAHDALKSRGGGGDRPPPSRRGRPSGGGGGGQRSLPPRPGIDPEQEQAMATAKLAPAAKMYMAYLQSQEFGRTMPFGTWAIRTGNYHKLGVERPYDVFLDTPDARLA